MTVKSIIDVDIKDEKFLRFKELFDQYQEQLGKMPESWKAVNREQDALFLGFQKVSAALMAHADLAHKITEEEHKSAAESERHARSWQSIARSARSTAADVAGMGQAFLKWGGISTLFTGLLGGGSLWGFTHLAGSVASLRQTAAGLGVTPGQATAFGVDFGRYLGSPQGTLSAVAGALTDPTSPAYRPIAALLGNVQGQNAAEVTSRLLQALPRLFPGGANQRTLGTVAEAYGLPNILSVEDIKRYLSAPLDERTNQEKDWRRDAVGLNLDPHETRAYQDFTTQLDRAGNAIFKIFADGLEPLVAGGDGGPLGQLSQSVTDVMKAFLGAAKDKHWVEQLSASLEEFSKHISSPEFGQNVKGFVDGVGEIGEKIKWLASWIPGPTTFDGLPDLLGPPQDRAAAASAVGIASRFFSPEPMSLHDIWYGKKNDPMLGLVRKLEGSGDQAVSPAGAIGRYQITPSTALTYHRDPSKLFDPAYNEATARIILADLAKKYSGNIDEILAAYNAGPGRADRFRAAGDNPAILPAETRAYLERAHRMGSQQIKVDVSNRAGADVVVSTQALATQAASPSWGF